MFQNLRAGDGALLGDVADDEDRGARSFGVFEQRGGAFADLRHAAGRRLDQIGVDRLDRVDDHQVGALLFELRHDVFEQRLGVDHAGVVADADTVGAHLDLLGRLLARDVEGFQPVVGQCDLQAERRFADARFAAQQHERSGNQTAAQHPVDLGVAQVEPRPVVRADLADALRGAAGQRGGHRGGDRTALPCDDLFGEGVPLPAGGAASHPFGRLVAALLAEICFFDLCHLFAF